MQQMELSVYLCADSKSSMQLAIYHVGSVKGSHCLILCGGGGGVVTCILLKIGNVHTSNLFSNIYINLKNPVYHYSF